jgi:hypothetical protein
MCGKKVKWEKAKEKNKKVALGATVFLLIWWEQFPCSAEMQHMLIFWPLHPLV